MCIRDSSGIGPVVDQFADPVVDDVGKVVIKVIRLQGETRMHLTVGLLSLIHI